MLDPGRKPAVLARDWLVSGRLMPYVGNEDERAIAFAVDETSRLRWAARSYPNTTVPRRSPATPCVRLLGRQPGNPPDNGGIGVSWAGKSSSSAFTWSGASSCIQ